VRVKSKWNKKDKTHSVEEIGAALAFIAFRIAQNGVLSLENNDYQTDSQAQRLKIIAEFLCFTIHIIDRMTIERFSDEDRVRFMTELAVKSAKHMEDNMRDILGKGDYRQGFIDTLNQRMNDYADFAYDKEAGGPSFPMRRFFGDLVTEQMGEKNKRWVADQIIDIEVPGILQTLERSVPNLFM
jgi:predicted GNAT family acetyltransferase